MSNDASNPSRRHFIKQSLIAGLGIGSIYTLADNPIKKQGFSPDYGTLILVNDDNTGLPLLKLPAGFRYTTFGWTGDPMRDGTPTPDSHDGMGAFAGEGSEVILVRNHERGAGGLFAQDTPAYDPLTGGGTTNLRFDGNSGKILEAWPSLTGTVANCAGGTTPWGTWLTCEETIYGPDTAEQTPIQHKHGYIFEVPAQGHANAKPITAMGRFVHEAIAVDPATGIVYLTEDRDRAGLYRFIPKVPQQLQEGGQLQMLAVANAPQQDLTQAQAEASNYKIEWVDIDEADPVDPIKNSVYQQGFAKGGATFSRLEGIHWGYNGVIMTSTDGGGAKQGQVWYYHPESNQLRLIFESPGADVLNYPDNVAVSPRGGIVLCEDGDEREYLHGLTMVGELFKFAENNVVLNGEKNNISGDFTGGEFAGSCFSPDGKWMFVNIQNPGITFAITGPWERGVL